MQRLAIVGSNDLGQLLAYHASSAGGFQIAGFFDDFHPAGTRIGIGVVLGPVSDAIPQFAAGAYDFALIGVGYRHFAFRKKIFETLNGHVPFARLIHPASYVDPSCNLGEGVVVLPGCTLDRNVTIEDNVILNNGCVIAHDTTIGAHSFLGPGILISGFSLIGHSCFLGIGTRVIDHLSLANFTRSGAGAVFVSDTVRPGLYLGVPARYRKE